MGNLCVWDGDNNFVNVLCFFVLLNSFVILFFMFINFGFMLELFSIMGLNLFGFVEGLNLVFVLWEGEVILSFIIN